MRMVLIFLAMVLILCAPVILLAGIGTSPLPVPPADAPWWASIAGGVFATLPDLMPWLVAVMGFVMGLLRATAEFLLWIHKRTESKLDDTMLAWVNSMLLWAATVAAWFGVGKPKSLDK